MQLDVNILNANPDLQTREIVYDTLVVAEYAEAMREGAIFPPVTVFFDGATYWLADGFHRWAAAQQAGIPMLDADVRSGGKREAILFAVGANAANGLRRTNADKRKAVMRLLSDTEWCEKSDNEIAKLCRVSQPFVSKIRPEISSYNGYKIDDSTGRTVTRNGSTYEMNTARIGKEQDDTPTAGHRFDAKVNKILAPYDVPPAPPMINEDDEPTWELSDGLKARQESINEADETKAECVTCHRYCPFQSSDKFYCLSLKDAFDYTGEMPCGGHAYMKWEYGSCQSCLQPLPVLST